MAKVLKTTDRYLWGGNYEVPFDGLVPVSATGMITVSDDVANALLNFHNGTWALVVASSEIIIEGNAFGYRPIDGVGASFQVGDLALNGWIDANTFGKVLSHNGGDPTLFSGWTVIEQV